MKIVSKIIKIVLNIFFIIWLFINTVIIITAILFPNDAPGFFSYKPFVVISGSNETNLEYGDFVIAKKTQNLNEDDVVVVKTQDRKATSYRIVEINGDNLKLENDSNTKILLSKYSIEGKTIVRIKDLGKFVLILKNPIIVIIYIIIGIIIGFIIYKIKLIF